jgi:hypothetical protein
MPSTEDIRKIVTEELSDATPLYAAVGAGDAARRRLATVVATVPTEVQARLLQVTTDPQAVRQQVLGAVQEVREKVTETVGKLAPGDVRELQDRAQSFAFQQVSRAADAAARARDLYTSLAERGRELLGREPESEPVAAPTITVVRVAEPPVAEPLTDKPPAAEPAPGEAHADQPPAAAKPAAKTSTPRKATAKKPAAKKTATKKTPKPETPTRPED